MPIKSVEDQKSIPELLCAIENGEEKVYGPFDTVEEMMESLNSDL